VDRPPYTIGTFKDKNNTEYLNYDPNAVLYILINSVQEQQAVIEELKKQIQVLESKLLK
jgi:hypothetical protein